MRRRSHASARDHPTGRRYAALSDNARYSQPHPTSRPRFSNRSARRSPRARRRSAARRPLPRPRHGSVRSALRGALDATVVGAEAPRRPPRRSSACSWTRARHACEDLVVDSVRGQLLIAGPTLQDPNFWRTVVLVVEHSDDGALGLVLNRPSESTVGEAVPELISVTDPEDEVLVGGPVGQSAVIVLADFEDPDAAALIAFDSVGVMAGGGPTTSSAMACGVRGCSRALRLGSGPARRRARAWRLDPRAGPVRRRVRPRADRALGRGARAQGRQLRAGGADADRSDA